MFHRILTGEYPFNINSFGDIVNIYSKSSLNFAMIDRLTCPNAVKYLMKNMLVFEPENRFGIGSIC